VRSWGNTVHSSPHSVTEVQAASVAQHIARATEQSPKNNSVLPFGMGRTYGDSCLNNGGTLLITTSMNRIQHFDRLTGVVRVESGIILSALSQHVVPHGWFLPVVPGTEQITIGGAIANDIHGKNHHRRGCFGQHVHSFELIRSNGERLVCSSIENSDLFRATIGGLGLTGLITWVELQLMRVSSSNIAVNTIACQTWEEIEQCLIHADEHNEYSVAWVDAKRGRGHVATGNHANDDVYDGSGVRALSGFSVFKPLLNATTVDTFNKLKFSRLTTGERTHTTNYESYLYPLDLFSRWNRIYGSKGFFQYQFVVPMSGGVDVCKNVVQALLRHDQLPYLTVLKRFGEARSPGMMSFPMHGLTLAIDMPNLGKSTLTALETCDGIVSSANGRVYPAKDARMAASTFQHMYRHALNDFVRFIDPHFSSTFWRRVMEGVR